MTDKPKHLKSVEGRIAQPTPGHADVMGDVPDAPRPLLLTTQVNSVREAAEFAEDAGLWIACYTNGCISPQALIAGVEQGKKLWQLLHGDPTILQQQGQLAQATGDVFTLNLVDPNQAIAMLEKRSQDAKAVATRIRQELLSSSHGNTET